MSNIAVQRSQGLITRRTLTCHIWGRVYASGSSRTEGLHSCHIARSGMHGAAVVSNKKIHARTYSCACTIPATPAIPSTHPIDMTSPLENTAAQYHTHLLIYTGKDDWSSKIDLEPGKYGIVVSALRKALKSKEAEILERGGPERKILIGMCSYESKTHDRSDLNGENGAGKGKAVLFPSGETVSFDLPDKDASEQNHKFTDSIAHLADRALSSRRTPQATPSSPPSGSALGSTKSIRPSRISILICSHGGRDIRCGILGPYLKTCISQIFQTSADLKEKFVVVSDPSVDAGPSPPSATVVDTEGDTNIPIPVSIGLISHVGGHKWAGNVLVYFHHDATAESSGEDSRTVKGVWYGRVNGENVEGILRGALEHHGFGGHDEFVRRIVY